MLASRAEGLGHVAVAAVAALIAIFGILGALFLEGRAGAEFDLDAEFALPAFFSAGLLSTAALLSLVARQRWLTLLFAFMAADEVMSLHEKLEGSLGVDWQLLYAPVVVLGGVGWAAVLQQLGPIAARVSWVSAALAWGAAQLVENLQWHGDRLRHAWMSVPEEVLEMTGSTLFVVGLAVVLLDRYRRLEPSAPPVGAEGSGGAARVTGSQRDGHTGA